MILSKKKTIDNNEHDQIQKSFQKIKREKAKAFY